MTTKTTPRATIVGPPREDVLHRIFSERSSRTQRRSRAEKSARNQGWDDCPARLSNHSTEVYDQPLTHNPFAAVAAARLLKDS